MEYQRRIVDGVLDEVFPELAAIALEGAKGVGKTATASQRAATALRLSQRDNRIAVSADPRLVTSAAKPVLIDEWQLVPEIWDVVRDAVDEDSSGGRFLLTGSAAADVAARIHSGAGRIVSVRMRPLSLAERGVASPTVSLRGALESAEQQHIGGITDVALPQYVDEILRSGFPGIRPLSDRARGLQLDGYISRAIDRDLPDAGIAVRRPAALHAWLAAYAAATASTAAYTTILDAATPGEADKPARQTTAAYREHLLRLFLLDPVPAWVPAFAPLKRLGATPKHHLVDPALAARLVGVGKAGLLVGEGVQVSRTTGTWLGALFESLVTQSVRVYADAIGASVGHLRTNDGSREIDLIVETSDRRVLALEVKLAASVGDADVRHLNWLQSELGERVVERIIVTTGAHAYRRPDGVAVVPFSLLGP